MRLSESLTLSICLFFQAQQFSVGHFHSHGKLKGKVSVIERVFCFGHMFHRENGGTLGMVPLIFNLVYPLSKGSLGELNSLGTIAKGPQHFPYECWDS